MNVLLALAPAFLRIIGAFLTSNPNVAKPATLALVSKTTELAAGLIERGEAGADALKALTEHVGKIVADNATRSTEVWAQTIPQSDWDEMERLHASAKAIIEATPVQPVQPPEPPTEPPAA